MLTTRYNAPHKYEDIVTRYCKRRECDSPLTDRTERADYCSDRCRLIAWEDRRVDETLGEITDALRPIVERLGHRARRDDE